MTALERKRVGHAPGIAESARQRVTVLLATHNGTQFLMAQLRSILDQRDVDVTVVVSDDSSTDGTQEILQRIAQLEPRVQLLSPGRFGSAADNFLRLLRDCPLDDADFVSFADQDDIWDPNKLSQALRALRANGADGYSSNLVAFDNRSGAEWIIDKSAPVRELDYLFGGASAGCTYVLRRQAALVVRDSIHTQPAAGWSHDWLFYAICRSHALTWTFDPSATIRYRQHSASAYGARSGWRGALARANQIRNGWYCNQILSNGRFLRCEPAERRVLERMAVLGARERMWLAANAFRCRRDVVGMLGLVAIAPFMGRGSDALTAEYSRC